MPEEVMFEITLSAEEIRTLAYSVNEAIRLWPGSPQRPPEEQEMLHFLKTQLFALQMELVLDQDGKRGEGEA